MITENIKSEIMKKGPIILLVMAMALTMSVAAGVKERSVTVVDDISDTKVVKASELIIVTPETFVFQAVNCDVTVLPELEVLKPLTSTSVSYDKATVLKSEKLYLLNCSIRQCSYRAVSTDNSTCNN